MIRQAFIQVCGNRTLSATPACHHLSEHAIKQHAEEWTTVWSHFHWNHQMFSGEREW